MRCCASPPPDFLWGFHCVLGRLGFSLRLDVVKLVGRTLQVLDLSPKWSPSPVMVHCVYLISTIIMSLLSVRVHFHIFEQVAPPIVPIHATLPSPICRDPIPFGVSPFNSCNPFYISSILHFSLYLWMFLLSCYCLFASISKDTF